jgi:hypothetical protein
MALNKNNLKTELATKLEVLRNRPGGGSTEDFAKIISDAIDAYIKKAEIYNSENGQATKNKIR